MHLERTERLAAPVQDWRDGGQRNSGESSQTDKRVCIARPSECSPSGNDTGQCSPSGNETGHSLTRLSSRLPIFNGIDERKQVCHILISFEFRSGLG